jgi:hypothetical protein
MSKLNGLDVDDGEEEVVVVGMFQPVYSLFKYASRARSIPLHPRMAAQKRIMVTWNSSGLCILWGLGGAKPYDPLRAPSIAVEDCGKIRKSVKASKTSQKCSRD